MEKNDSHSEGCFLLLQTNSLNPEKNSPKLEDEFPRWFFFRPAKVLILILGECSQFHLSFCHLSCSPPSHEAGCQPVMLLLGWGIPTNKTGFATTYYWDGGRLMVSSTFFNLAPSHSSSKKSWENGARCQDWWTPAVKIDSLPPRPPPPQGRKTKTLWRSIWIQNLVAKVSGDMFFLSKVSLFHQWWQGVKPLDALSTVRLLLNQG